MILADSEAHLIEKTVAGERLLPEEGLRLLVGIVLGTAQGLLDSAASGMDHGGGMTARERRHWYVNTGRWLVLAGQAQEVIHSLIMLKGACRK